MTRADGVSKWVSRGSAAPASSLQSPRASSTPTATWRSGSLPRPGLARRMTTAEGHALCDCHAAVAVLRVEESLRACGRSCVHKGGRALLGMELLLCKDGMPRLMCNARAALHPSASFLQTATPAAGCDWHGFCRPLQRALARRIAHRGRPREEHQIAAGLSRCELGVHTAHAPCTPCRLMALQCPCDGHLCPSENFPMHGAVLQAPALARQSSRQTRRPSPCSLPTKVLGPPAH